MVDWLVILRNGNLSTPQSFERKIHKFQPFRVMEHESNRNKTVEKAQLHRFVPSGAECFIS